MEEPAQGEASGGEPAAVPDPVTADPLAPPAEPGGPAPHPAWPSMPVPASVTSPKEEMKSKQIESGLKTSYSTVFFLNVFFQLTFYNIETGP